MICSGCGRDLPAAFPGATISCACGRVVELPRAFARARKPDSGPYRSASAVAGAAPPPTTCPYCSNAIGPLVRICPHCDVRLESVRCDRCFSLQPPGAFACARCGQAMQLEPLLDATDAPCPRCAAPLEVAEGDARTHECPRCGGIFVSREALAEILCRAEIGGALAPPPPRAPSMLDEVRYVPCPLCHASMNRANFGKVSGVIVDVCAKHGTWFDAGELTRVVAFAASGGLERTRAREAEEKKDADRRSAAPSLELAAANVRLDARQRLSVWEDFLAIMLRW